MSDPGMWRGMTIGLGLLLAFGGASPLGWLVSRPHATPRPGVASLAPARARTPFEAAIATASRLYLRAAVASTWKLDAVEEWDPDALNGSAPEHYRQMLMARTRELGLAAGAAREANMRAGSGNERYRAVMLLARIDCDLGHHRTELREARQLVALRSADPEAWEVLQRAAKCNVQLALAQQAESRLKDVLRLEQAGRVPKVPAQKTAHR